MSTAGASPRVPIGGVLTPRTEHLIRLGSVGSASLIAVSAMVLSYAGLLDLALDAGVESRLALLVPVMVDGLQFVGSLGVVYSTLSGLRSWYPWLLMLMGVSISAWGNWQAAPDDLTAKLLHAAAPVILALVLEELLRVMRHKVQLHAASLATSTHLGTASVDGEVGVEAKVPVSGPLAESSVPGRGSAAPDGPVDAVAVVTSVDDVAATGTLVGAATVVGVAVAAEPSGVPAAGADQASVDQASVDLAPVDQPPVVQAAPVESSGARDDDPESLPPYTQNATFKEQVKEILVAEPDTPAAKIARLMAKDPSWTRKIVKQARAELDTAAEVPSQPQGATAQDGATTVGQPVAATATTDSGPGTVSGESRAVTVPAVGSDLSNADPFATTTPLLPAH